MYSEPLFFPSLWTYIRQSISRIPGEHWAVIGGVSIMLILFLIMRKTTTVYGSVALGMAVFSGLFLLDALVLVRCLGIVSHTTEFGIDLGKEFQSVFHGTLGYRVGMLSNVLAFIPLGFFLAGSLSTSVRFRSWRRIGVSVLVALGLSFCIECMQLFLHVGFFEITDLVMNTFGAFIGSGVAVLLFKKKESGRLIMGSQDGSIMPEDILNI